MKPSESNSNLLVTDDGTLIFLGAGEFTVMGIKEFGEDLYFTLKIMKQ